MVNSRLSSKDYDLVYFSTGRVAHVQLWVNAFETYCLMDLTEFERMRGTGSQAERERARSLPLCSHCRPYFSE